MKCFLLFITLYAAISGVYAQDVPYIPTAVEGANWILYKSETVHYPYQNFLQTIDGDTVVDGRSYKKLYEHTIDYLDEVDDGVDRRSTTPPYLVFPERRLVGMLRDDIAQRKVFGIVRGNFSSNYAFSTDTLLHDFSLGIGDTLVGFRFVGGISSVVVEESGIENRFGMERRFQKSGQILEYYEGIGSLELGPASGGQTSGVACCAKWLVDFCFDESPNCRVWLTSVTELTSDDIINISPNPVNQILHLELTQVNVAIGQLNYTITSNNGRILQTGPVTGNSMDIDVGSLPSGLHFFSITNEHRLLAVRRFFKR